MSLRGRLSAAAAFGVLIVVGVVSGILFMSYAAGLRSRVDAGLVDAAQQAVTLADQVKQASDKGPLPNLAKPITVGSIRLELLLGPVSAGEPTAVGSLGTQDVAVAQGARPAYFMTTRADGQAYRVYTAAMPGTQGGALVRTSQADTADNGALRAAGLLLAGLTIAAAAATYGLAWLSAGRILRPVAQLTAAAEHVTRTGDLTARLGHTMTDEVGRLGASFDTMLAALEESVVAQRQLVSDASHELRTPLTSLTTNLDLLQDGAGLGDPDAPDLVRRAREQAGELNRLITDLLDLARWQDTAPHRVVVPLDTLVRGAVDQCSTTGAEVVTDDEPCLVRVDPDAVHRAVVNLVDNALKWNPSDAAPVHVAISGGTISVTDHGPGIPEADLPHIFERFYRASTAQALPGAGLGLAIVGTITRANGGTIAVRTGPDGTTVTLTLPTAAQAEDDAGEDGLPASGASAE